MGTRKLLIFNSLFLVLAALFSGVDQGQAQQAQAPQKAVGASNSQINKAPGAPNIAEGPPVCQPGQMRCITNDHRWAAAIRNSDTRAADLRMHRGRTSTGGEVK